MMAVVVAPAHRAAYLIPPCAQDNGRAQMRCPGTMSHDTFY